MRKILLSGLCFALVAFFMAARLAAEETTAQPAQQAPVIAKPVDAITKVTQQKAELDAKYDAMAKEVADAGKPIDVKIGFVVKGPEEPWFQLEWKFAEKCAKDKGFKLVKIGATNGEQVLAAMDNLAAQNAQGVVICTPDVKLGPAIKAKADMNDLKVLSVDDRFLNADGTPLKDVPYVGISAYDIGKLVGNALVDQIKKRGWDMKDVDLLAVTFKELTTAKERVNGVEDALIANGMSLDQILEVPQKTPDVNGGFDASNTELTKHPNVKHWIVCGMNDETVTGAIRALEGRKYDAKDIIGIGINGDETAIIEFKKDNPTGFFASVLLSAKKHGYMTCEMMYDWITRGTVPPKETFTSGIMIDRSNYKSVLQDQGVIQ